MDAPAAALGPEFLADVQQDFDRRPACRLAQNAVAQTTVTDVALNRSVVTGIDHTFSHKLDDWEVTNQKKSGRCWMFALLNLLRVGAMKKMNLKKFEFSQNYTLFWDKFERANYFLEAIIETGNRPADDRTVAWLLDHPLDDGGQWNMGVSIVRKHGVVPQAVMPETESSSNTRLMNGVLLEKLREGAQSLRELRGQGAPMEAARASKREILKVIHRILCIHLGTPPTRFQWQWNDDDREFHRDGELTPLQFAEKYVDLPLDEYVCLVHDPRASSPFGRTFTVEYLGNVVGGEPVRYLNVEIDVMKRAAAAAIKDGEPVWFGCDVGKMMRRDMGVWDRRLFDYETLYDTSFDLDKESRLDYHQTLMTHAMLFTGVDLVNDRPRRWRVENSWGEENGRKGFYAMNDSWFDEYMFEIAARRSALPADLQAALDVEPIVLAPWDPMGALANAR
ncbi:MAG: C1 family peptidase [Planctomycetes bacterium]|nr:C1 family peptidase [Planctomycetota bacterium]